MAIGLISGLCCYVASTKAKQYFRYDDSLDVFGVHGVGGFVGTILVGLFASPTLGGNQAGLDIGHQLAVQSAAAVGVTVYSLVASIMLIKLTSALVGLRVDEMAEREGLDSAEHAERGYTL